MKHDTNLVWIDLEMTGLAVESDVVLEIATVITDKNLNVLEESKSLVIHYPDEVLQQMNAWCQKQHKLSGLVKDVQESTITLQQAEQETLELIKKYCYKEKSMLCGNSIWQDRNFLLRYMPSIINYLHYKLIDVTTVQQLVKYWYPSSPFIEFKKKDAHRALSDIHESIEELRHYRTYFFIPS